MTVLIGTAVLLAVLLAAVGILLVVRRHGVRRGIVMRQVAWDSWVVQTPAGPGRVTRGFDDGMGFVFVVETTFRHDRPAMVKVPPSLVLARGELERRVAAWRLTHAH